MIRRKKEREKKKLKKELVKLLTEERKTRPKRGRRLILSVLTLLALAALCAGAAWGGLRVKRAVVEAASRTGAYARRQRTWFRSEPGITWIEAGEGALAAARAALAPWLRQCGHDVYAGHG